MKNNVTNTMMDGVFLLILTAIILLVNVVVSQLPPLRVDLTESGMYSLTDASKNVVGRLEDRIKVEAYFTDNLPAPYNQHAAYVRDLLEEYQTYSKGNLVFEFIDPGKEETARQEMMMKGIPPVQIQELKNDEFGIKQAYMGIVLTYGTKKETVPVVQNTDKLEYDITSLIKKISTQELKSIAFSSGHGEPKLDEKMKRVKQELERNYKVISFDFTEKKDIPADVVTMLVIGPTESWTDEDKFKLDQFLMRGGTVGFFIDNVTVDLQQLQAKDVDTGLGDMLTHYGITVEKNLIADPQCKRITVASQQGMFRMQHIVNFPFFPAINDLDRSHVLTGDIQELSFPFMSSLTVKQSNDKVQYSVLAKTTDQSWQEKGTYDINPMEPKTPPENPTRGPFNALAVATGRFDSFYADKADQGGVDYIQDPANVLKQSAPTRIMVIGDASMPQDEFFDPANVIFFVNAMDWLAQDGDLISIRTRGLTDRPLEKMEAGTKNLMRYMNLFGVPILLILFGIGRWQLRKMRYRNFKL